MTNVICDPYISPNTANNLKSPAEHFTICRKGKYIPAITSAKVMEFASIGMIPVKHLIMMTEKNHPINTTLGIL